MTKYFDPVRAMEKRGALVRLGDPAKGEPDLVVEHDTARPINRGAGRHMQWVATVMDRYNALIRLQFAKGTPACPYRSVQWLISHGYVRVVDGRYQLVK
jgi:hypothetical protein